ncbi:MAG: hypothetical protein GPJ54_08690 [Candidatus Heimdallarchaeota archaeon]|nr:hypothetical protein [Candidatus Heimdallarchaeota archaeon]
MKQNMKKIVLLILLLGLVYSNSTFTTLGSVNGHDEDITVSQVDSKIINFGHIPLFPIPDQNITVFISLNFQPPEFTNLTLIYKINQSEEIRVEMITKSSNQFEFNISGQSINSSILYKIEYYVNNKIVDLKPLNGFVEIIINLDPSNANITIISGQRISLNPSLYTINDEFNLIEMQINITSPVELFFNITDRTKIEDIAGYIPLSEKVNIELNDSNALESATLIINYDQSLINEFGVTESTMNLLTRESKLNSWTEHPIIIDETSNQIIANVSHFSEWVVTSQNSILRLLSIDNIDEIKLNFQNHIRLIGSNVGNIRADNVTVKIFLPSGLLLNNETSTYTINHLYPLENITVVWSFYADMPGIYTIILLLESSNAENDIGDFQTEISNLDNTDDESITNNSDTTDQSKINSYFNLEMSLSVIFILFIWKRNKRKELKKIY